MHQSMHALFILHASSQQWRVTVPCLHAAYTGNPRDIYKPTAVTEAKTISARSRPRPDDNNVGRLRLQVTASAASARGPRNWCDENSGAFLKLCSHHMHANVARRVASCCRKMPHDGKSRWDMAHRTCTQSTLYTYRGHGGRPPSNCSL